MQEASKGIEQGRYWDWDNPEYPHSPLACLIGHEALFQGEVLEPTPGYEYTGTDSRGLPIHLQAEGDQEEWEIWDLAVNHLPATKGKFQPPESAF
jgi:hypothetical protein